MFGMIFGLVRVLLELGAVALVVLGVALVVARPKGGVSWLTYRVLLLASNTAAALAEIESRGIAVFVGGNGAGKSLVMVKAVALTLLGTKWVCYDADHRHQAPFRAHAEECHVCEVGTVTAYAAETAEDLQELLQRGVLCSLGVQLLETYGCGVHLVYSTVPLYEGRGKLHPLYVPLTDYVQLLGIEHAVVCFDEVAGIADSSGSATVPVQVVNWEHTLRKRDVAQYTTTPAYERCALPIRQVTQVVVECRGSAKVKVEQNGRRWKANRIVRFAVYDAFSFAQWHATEGQRSKIKPIARGVLYVPTEPARLQYNTRGQVHALGHITESGMCMDCGGGISRPRCACPRKGSVPGVEETVSAGGSRVRRRRVGGPDGGE